MDEAIKVYQKHIDRLHNYRREDQKIITEQAKRIGYLEPRIESMVYALKEFPKNEDLVSDGESRKGSTSTQ